MDYQAFLSKSALGRNPSPIRSIAETVDHTYLVMAGGVPNPETFPIKAAELTLRDGSKVQMSEQDMQIGLQYGRTDGSPEMTEFVRTLIKRLHDPPSMNNPDHPGALSIAMTTGSQHGIYEIFDLLINEGDIVLTTSETYTALLDVVRPIGGKIIGVKVDKDGVIVENLRDILSQWPKPDGPGPALGKLKALYCVPNGSNPTGLRFTVERKREVYKLAREYNFLIVEDDAYYMLEQRPFTESFLSMDEDGRVIRLETFSKTFAPGLRIGVMAGPAPIVEKAVFLAQCSTQGCAAMSQMMFMHVCRKWGVDGYLEHCERLNKYYENRKQICETLANKYLRSKGLAEWDSPTGGMFLWVRLIGVKDAAAFVFKRLVPKRKLVLVPGDVFTVEAGPIEYVRISFSTISEQDMEKAFAILAEELELYRSEQKE